MIRFAICMAFILCASSFGYSQTQEQASAPEVQASETQASEVQKTEEKTPVIGVESGIGATHGKGLGGIRENNAAVKSLERENPTQAESELLQALAKDPFSPITRLNLGWLYEREKHPDRALKEYESVARQEGLPAELKFLAHFNAGNASVQLKDTAKNTDFALKHYQAALDLMPDSKEVKTNIELLMQSGQGKGKGEQGGGQNGEEQNDQQGSGQGKNEKEKEDEGQGKKPKPFKSENLTKEDVKKILEELKSQEKKIRALEYGKKGKEVNLEKDW